MSDPSTSSSPDYMVFMEIISSLPCYRFHNAQELKDHLSEITEKDLVAELSTCSDRVRDAVVSPLLDEYFIRKDTPTIGYYCKLRQKVADNHDVIKGYLNQLIKSIVIVLTCIFVYVSYREVDVNDSFNYQAEDMKVEIENILIEHLLQDDKYVRLSDIKKAVIRSGSFPPLSYFLWKPVGNKSGLKVQVEFLEKKSANVVVMDRLIHDQLEVYWRWMGEKREIRRTSRRPELKRNLAVNEDDSNRYFRVKMD